MRILLAAIIWVVLVGGLAWYMNQRTGAATVTTQERAEAPGIYAVTLTPTFSAAPDPFALRLSDDDAPPALLVRLNGDVIFEATDKLEAGETVVIETVSGIKVGENEFFIEAHPPGEEANQAHALRVAVLRDGDQLVEETLWSEPGLRLAAPLTLEITEAGEEASHEHE
jgi:hypothetical protein